MSITDTIPLRDGIQGIIFLKAYILKTVERVFSMPTLRVILKLGFKATPYKSMAAPSFCESG